MTTLINGQQIHLERHGETGTPVLLIMGFGMSCEGWRPQINALSPHHQVAAFDNRGCARSAPVNERYRMADLAADATGVLDHLGWDGVHVVGVSMGGMVAQHVALANPGRIRSLTLIATHAGGRPTRWLPKGSAARLFVKANTNTGSKRFEALTGLLYPTNTQHEAPSPDQDDSLMAQFGTPIARKTAAYQMRAVMRHDTRKRLHELEGTPTLILKPAKDILVPPRCSDELHRLIPGSRLVSFSNAGHGITFHRKDAVNRQLLSHFSGADLGSW